mgnify:CR=1 FL=1
MSYCVNCGVELEKACKACPLCGAKHHPFQQEDEFTPFVSEMHEQIEKKKNELGLQTKREKSLFLIILLLFIIVFTQMYLLILNFNIICYKIYNLEPYLN